MCTLLALVLLLNTLWKRLLQEGRAVPVGSERQTLGAALSRTPR